MSELHRMTPPRFPITRRAMLRGMAGIGAVAATGGLAAACGVRTAPPTGAPASAAPPTAAPSAAPGASEPPPTEAAASVEPTPVPPPEGELYVYNWADYIGKKTIKNFEKATGIKVKYDFFDTVDTMLAKIATGNSGYDVTFPTSINVAGLKQRGLIQALDLSQLPNLVNLAPEWADPGYDPGNANSVPYMWWTTGVAYDKKKVDGRLTSWASLWDPQYSGKLAMLDDYRECFAAALLRLGFDVNTTDDAQLDQALALLQEQKPLLRTYSTDDIGVLSTGDAWIMHAWGADVYQVQQERASVTYYLPSEGGVRGSDTMVLLAGAQHPVAAHLFMNYMLDAEVAADNTNYIGYMGPNEAAKKFIDPYILEDPTVNPDKAVTETLQEILDLGTDEVKYQDRWRILRAGA
jgi:spermidine/putrescine transport system substrate-binding protein